MAMGEEGTWRGRQGKRGEMEGGKKKKSRNTKEGGDLSDQ